MNKLLLSTALAAVFGVAALAPQAASASDGTITITGAITAATCTVNVNGAGSSATVALPTVQSSQFTATGQTAGWTAVTIALSGCTANTATQTKVLPFFEQGPTTDMATGYLTKGTGTATGAEIAISQSNNILPANLVLLNKPAGSQNAGTAVAFAGNPTFTYYAGYVSTAASVGAGSINTSAQYDLNYQ